MSELRPDGTIPAATFMLAPKKYRCLKCSEVRAFVGIHVSENGNFRSYCASCFEKLIKDNCGEVVEVEE
jgi:hypothetical protein